MRSYATICRLLTRLGLALACAFLVGFHQLDAAAVPPSQPQPAGLGMPEVKSSSIRRVLFLGNSITLHGPKADIGWTGNWGMAASSEDKDYVHLVQAGLTRHIGAAPEMRVRNIADFERNYSTYEVKTQLQEVLAFDPDLVVLAIGENVSGLSSDKARVEFKEAVMRLLNALVEKRRPRIVVRSSFWADPAKDAVLRESCDAVRARFVDAGPIGKDPSNAARAERPFKHDGVAGHPGDKGMQALADVILKACLRE